MANLFIMKSIFLTSIYLMILAVAIVPALQSCVWAGNRSQPDEESTVLFPGIAYHREVRQNPRPMVIHVVNIDLRQKGLKFLVTPGDSAAELPLSARTTSRFLEEFGLQLAINGDGFSPWESGVLSSYPQDGDPVEPSGMAASRGEIYAQGEEDEPTLYISRSNKARFIFPDGKVYNAISGTRMLLERGEPTPDLDSEAEPRTAVGLDQRGRKLILVVVDGRQPGYSQGATLAELAQILKIHGAYSAMNLDGGGSSTLVMQGKDGHPILLNSPVDDNRAGRERPVGNHLGIFAPATNSSSVIDPP